MPRRRENSSRPAHHARSARVEPVTRRRIGPGRDRVGHGSVVARARAAARVRNSDLKILPAPHTTPEALELNQLLAEGLAQGVTESVMEVSSHALEQQRVFGIQI